MTQVGPAPGRPVDIKARRTDIIHEVREDNGHEILNEMLKRKYPVHYAFLNLPNMDLEYKPWNIVVLENEDRLRIRVADSWDPKAVVDFGSGKGKVGRVAIFMEMGIKHDQVAEGKKCIFAGTLTVQGEALAFKLLLKNDSGAYGRQIRIYPEKIASLKAVLANRFRIPADDIAFEAIQD